MKPLLKRISQANHLEIPELVDAVISRYNELYPDWEISTVSIEKSRDRNTQIDRIISVMQALKE